MVPLLPSLPQALPKPSPSLAQELPKPFPCKPCPSLSRASWALSKANSRGEHVGAEPTPALPCSYQSGSRIAFARIWRNKSSRNARTPGANTRNPGANNRNRAHFLKASLLRLPKPGFGSIGLRMWGSAVEIRNLSQLEDNLPWARGKGFLFSAVFACQHAEHRFQQIRFHRRCALYCCLGGSAFGCQEWFFWRVPALLPDGHTCGCRAENCCASGFPETSAYAAFVADLFRHANFHHQWGSR